MRTNIGLPVSESAKTAQPSVITSSARCGKPEFATPILTLLLLVFSFALFAETFSQQSFEAQPTDTWNYTANPTGMNRLVWWGRSDQPMGGANAQSGDWYWASWDLDNIESTLTFDTLDLPLGYLYTLSFYYYTNGLNPATDYSKYSIAYDSGSVWSNWTALSPDTDAWTAVTIEIPSYASQVRLKLAAQYDGFAKYAHWDSFTITRIPTPPTAPVVYNTNVAQRTDGSGVVDIWYDLFDANGDNSTISLLLSEDAGASFTITPNPANLSGDIGEDVSNGSGRHIVWIAGAEAIPFDNNQYKLRIVAEDNSIPPAPEGFIYVPAGTFTMGDTPGQGSSDELPTHSVTLNSFYIGKYEVTQAEYSQYMTPGSSWTSNSGLGNNDPAYYVSWYAILKYCNLRSMAEGLTPVYTISGSTNPASWGAVPTSNNATWNAAVCNWSANGYRLPTEAEWEYAARGATNTPDYLYSGSDDINAVAWYSGYNNPNGSKPVGTKANNGLGIYDMSGNLWEWCWDWYSSSYYSSSPGSNPTGPASGSFRLLRGGVWNGHASSCRVSIRNDDYPSSTYGDIGFRLCRATN